MLEIKKTVVSFDERDLIELERIIMDSDEKEAYLFLKRSLYDRIAHAQQGKLKSPLDGNGGHPVERFIKDDKQIF